MKHSSWQPPSPIAQAPIKKCHHYGPCILSPGINGFDWVIGEWDGEKWWTIDGEYCLKPTHYSLLPSRSVLEC
jgi:hypothetical protein